MIRRIAALLASGGDVLLFRQRELYHMTAFVNHYTKAPVRFVVGLSLVIRAFEDLYGNLEGSRLEALGRLFAHNVRIYVHPMSAEDLRGIIPTAQAKRSGKVENQKQVFHFPLPLRDHYPGLLSQTRPAAFGRGGGAPRRLRSNCR